MINISRRGFLNMGGVAVGGVLATGTSATPAHAGLVPGAGPGGRAALPNASPPAELGPAGEPDARSAATWWPPQRQVWTPIGWKGHLFRFNVFYNGLLMAEPGPAWMTKDNVAGYQGRGLQLQFLPPDFHGNFAAPPTNRRYLWQDDLGVGEQSWNDDAKAPVLETYWRLPQGVVVRQSVFGHLKGGGAYGKKTDPLYAWVRLEAVHVDEVRAPAKLPFVLRLARRHLQFRDGYADENGVTLESVPDQAAMPGRMRVAPGFVDGPNRSVQIEHLDSLVRLGTVPLPADSVTFTETDAERVYDLKVTLDLEAGKPVDLVVAMLPQSRTEFRRELELGWAGALAEAEDYWTSTADPAAATVHTPEPSVNRALRRFVELAEIVGETSPESGKPTFLTGSFGYDVLWATPTSMVHHMLLDPLGQHQISRRHLAIYNDTQGTRVAPGKPYQDYGLHPGYLGSPAHLQAFDWLSDHGAILQNIAYHALVTHDQKFADDWLEIIVKACEFIRDACEVIPHGGVKGLMPAAHATDELLDTQGTWSQAWNYKGLATAVKLLKRLDHPRADEFDQAREKFRKAMVDAYRGLMEKQPTWSHPDGSDQPVPLADYTDRPFHIFQDAFLLDGGPLFFVWAGVFAADDPLMRSHLDYFRVGPNTELWDVRSNPIHRALLIREVSSCEPCYSWNLSHSWQAGDRARFLEGVYSLLNAGISPQTYISNEHRHGMYGQLSSSGLIVWHLLKAVIDAELVDGQLHLLRLCPLSWLSADEQTVFDQIPTEHGRVDLRFRLADGGARLDVEFEGHWHGAAPEVLLHLPPLDGLKTVRINGADRPAGDSPISL
ncbi:hypothetical protein [Microlunatus speluncae]|uniref:hypothetical protein n=1 Tax=Microlunatus speluncae TaxID=2594267 RepID=UPI00126683BA|nr:hypothetical protein [Microlunatus speluncae]